MSTRPRNDDLPILAELGDDLADGFRRAERAESARRNRRRFRNVAVATAALFVVVPGAVATRYIWAPDPSAPGSALESSRAVQIADGKGDLLSWRLSAAASEQDGVCWQLALFTAAESYGRGLACMGDTLSQAVDVATSYAGGETFAYGGLDPQVARVVVDPGAGVEPKDAQIVVAPPDRVEQAGLPAGARAYVASFLGDLTDGPPPTVTAFDASGREIGRMPPSR